MLMPSGACSFTAKVEEATAFSCRFHNSLLQTRHRKLGCGDGEKKEKCSVVLVVRCARGRKTLKNKRHAVRPAEDPIRALVSTLSTEDNNIYAALEYHSKSMELNDWFTLFEELGRRDLWLLSLEVFRWMQQQKWYRPDDGFYAKIISILGKKGQLRLAIWLFREMKKQGCHPDSSVYNSLINAYLRSNNKELALIKAFAYYERMKKTTRCRPNLVTYNTLLRACAQTKNMQKMDDLFKEMKLEGFKPDNYTFNGILDAYGKAGEILEMELLLKKMRESKVTPDCITFNTLIDAYGKAGIIVKMEETLRNMAAAKVKPQLSTFNALINNYGCAKRVDKMELVFKSMSMLGVPPTLITYEVLMKGYGNAGCFNKMQSCFKDMYEAGFKPETTTLNAMMDVYCSRGLVSEAEKLLDNASIMGIEPTHVSYLILLRGYSKHGCTEQIEALMKRMDAVGIQLNEKFFVQSVESLVLAPKGGGEPTKAVSARRSKDSRNASGSSKDQRESVLLHT